MSALIICLLVLGVALVAVKVYFQEKEKQAVESEKAEYAAEQSLPNIEKTNEEIVAERLAEIAEFEKNVEDSVVKEVQVSESVKNVRKPKEKTPNKGASKNKRTQQKTKSK